MEYVDQLHHLHVKLDIERCGVAPDERTRMQQALEPLGDLVQDFPGADLCITLIHYPRSETYRAEAKLKLPGQTLFTADRDAYLDSAFQRCVRKLMHIVDACKEHPHPEAEEQARPRSAPQRSLMLPADPDAGALGEAVAAGDYRAFRTALLDYEEWLRKRAGRWIQRYPEAEKKLGRGLSIGDLVEEVYLNAFDGYARRPVAVPFHEWLDSLLDPSLKLLLRHPDEESEVTSFARTVREGPLK